MSEAARESNIPLMKRLLAEGKSEGEIEQAFLVRYAEQGKTDPEWVRKRVAIYRGIATREESPDEEGLTPERTVAVLNDLVQRGLTNEHFRRLHHWGDDPVRAKRTSINVHLRYCQKTSNFKPADRSNRGTLRRLLHVATHMDAVQRQGLASAEDWEEALAAAREAHPIEQSESRDPATRRRGLEAALLQLKPYSATEEGRRALSAFADSVAEAHGYGAEMWGVIVSQDLRWVGLTVGDIAITAIGVDLTHDMRRDGIEPPGGAPCWVCVEVAPDRELPAALVSELASDPDWVPVGNGNERVGTRRGYYFASQERPATWGHVLAAQAPALRMATERSPNGLDPQAHSLHLDGVLTFLEQELGRRLPRPEISPS